MKNLSNRLALGLALASPLLLNGCVGGPYIGVGLDDGPGYYDYPGYYGGYYGGGYYRRSYGRGGNYYHGESHHSDAAAHASGFSHANVGSGSHASVSAAHVGGGGGGGHAGGGGGGGHH
jgi:hypothetical protein